VIDLGKVRTEAIKRVARELLEKFSDRLSTDFEANKMAVNELVNFDTKRLRNRIAGYVTSLKKVQLKRQASSIQEEAAPPEEG